MSSQGDELPRTYGVAQGNHRTHIGRRVRAVIRQRRRAIQKTRRQLRVVSAGGLLQAPLSGERLCVTSLGIGDGMYARCVFPRSTSVHRSGMRLLHQTRWRLSVLTAPVKSTNITVTTMIAWAIHQDNFVLPGGEVSPAEPVLVRASEIARALSWRQVGAFVASPWLDCWLALSQQLGHSRDKVAGQADRFTVKLPPLGTYTRYSPVAKHWPGV